MEVDAGEYANVLNEICVRTLEPLHGKPPTNILMQECHLSHCDEKFKSFSLVASSPGKDNIFFCFAYRDSLKLVMKSPEIKVVK